MSRHERALPAVLTAPRVQLGVGVAALLATAGAVRHDRVGPRELWAFRAVNDLPDSAYLPAWAVMQLGAFGAIPAAAAAAWLAGDRELAGRLLVGGTGTWALAKAVKQLVRRPRPATLLSAIRRRGRDASGLGYLSGHAGVAVALGAAALPHLGPRGRALTLTAIPLVGLARVYVGAHFPLDIAGGAALGLAVNAAAGTAGHRGQEIQHLAWRLTTQHLAALHSPRADPKMVNSKDVTPSKTVVNVYKGRRGCDRLMLDAVNPPEEKDSSRREGVISWLERRQL